MNVEKKWLNQEGITDSYESMERFYEDFFVILCRMKIKKESVCPLSINWSNYVKFYLFILEMISFMMKSNHNMSLLFFNISTYNETCLAKRPF